MPGNVFTVQKFVLSSHLSAQRGSKGIRYDKNVIFETYLPVPKYMYVIS